MNLPSYNAAFEYLTKHGYEVIGGMIKKNAIVAWERKTDTMVFAKVRRHVKLTYRNRLRRVAKAKRVEFSKACAAWRRTNKWHGAWRIDIVDVYGDGNNRPLVDHIMSVKVYGNVKK